MTKRLTVVLSQGQSQHPAKRKLEEDLVTQLLFAEGIEVSVVPNLYDLAPDGTGVLCLQGIRGDMVVLAWHFPRAAFWTLDRYGVRGRFGTTLLVDESAEDDEEQEENGHKKNGNGSAGDAPVIDAAVVDGGGKLRVLASRPQEDRTIYCIDLRARNDVASFVDEIKRIAAESSIETVPLLGIINGTPRLRRWSGPRSPAGSAGPIAVGLASGADAAAPQRIDEAANRRWYPVIDYSRCTNCMECIDFCLFGVYGVDKVETILVEQPENCRKGCPACSRVCPENAIMFPQHKSPAIAGGMEAAGGLKIDLSLLFGGGEGKDAVATAVLERDEQLQLAGRQTVGMTVGLAKRQADKTATPKDDLDHLVDALDALDL